MGEQEQLSREHLYELLKEEGIDRARLSEILSTIHPVDLASFLNDLEADDKVEIFNALAPQQAAQVLDMFPQETKFYLAGRVESARLAEILTYLPADVATDIVMHAPPVKQKELLDRMSPETRREIQKLIVYPRNTAGGIMNPKFVKVPLESNVADVLKLVKDSKAETIEDIYVVDARGRLRGQCSLRTLLGMPADAPLKNLYLPASDFVGPYVDQEDVARMVAQRNVKSIPVVDNDLTLLGVVTINDILHVVTQEASEDIMKFAGAGGAHPLYDSTLKRLRTRLPWLMVTVSVELTLALIISTVFQQTLERAVMIAAFIPVIMATGGNVGLQSSTVIVRALAQGTLNVRDTFTVIFSELQVGFLISAVCGTITAAIGLLIHLSHPQVMVLSATILIAMIGAVTISAAVAAATPLLLVRLRQDPAVSSGPFITSLNDVIGTTTYLFLATLLQL